MRRHSPAVFLNKKCNESVEIDLKDKKMFFEKGSMIYIPFRSILMDPDYYENPLEYFPERFDAINGGVKAFKERGPQK